MIFLYFCGKFHTQKYHFMSLSNSKKKELFEYYSEYGFQNPTEKIVRKLDICHKTFFNRYGNKANSIEIAWQYWQDQSKKKWDTLMMHCNHSVEALTVTLYSIRASYREEPYFFEYTRQNRKYLDPNSFFYTAIRTVLERGQKCFHVHEELNMDTYIVFLLNNLFLIDVEADLRPIVLKYVLSPALTERGMELFMETPFS